MWLKMWVRTLASLAVLLLLTVNLAVAAGPRDESKSYLVGFRSGASARGLAIAGVRVVTEWPEIGAAHVTATSNGLRGLQNSPMIEYVEEDVIRTVMGHGAPYADGALTWGVQAVHAQEAWNLGATGSTIKVCVLDTGIDFNQPEFQRADGTSVIKGSKNFANDGHPTAQDGNGHGTHVAGTIAGQLSVSGSRVGVAPDVELYVARVLGDDGSGSTSGVLNGLNWCVDTVKAHIASMSLGGSLKSRTEETAYNSAYNKGMLTIAAAGNSGNNRLSYPAGYASVVSVAAVAPNLTRASFSQYNKDVELAGPGVSVLSSVQVGTGGRSTVSEDNTGYLSNALEFSGVGTVTGPLVECGLADSTTSCTNQPATGAWVALVKRGTITFTDKHNNVKAQGASAMIITNNDTANPDDPGGFALGSGGTWLPSASVSYNSGVAIRSGGLGTGNVNVVAWDYAYLSGTSMATPHASAVAALAWSAKPTLTNAKIRTILQSTAKDLGAAGRDTFYGYGLVQADAAVNLATTTN